MVDGNGDWEEIDLETGEILSRPRPEGETDAIRYRRGTAVAPSRPSSDYVPAPLVSPTEIIERRKAIEAIVQDNLTEGIDYGTIPGTPKPSLWKPGAERLANWFGYAITFPAELARHTEDWNAGFLDYNYTCRLIHKPTGVVVAECEGSCNSHEKKYAKARERNATLGDQKNTLQKMAQKRAIVGAVLLGCALSDRFTQDIEDTGTTGNGGSDPSNDRPAGGAAGAVPADPLDYEMPFGKHAGKTVRDLPIGYVRWMVKKGGDIAPAEVLAAAAMMVEAQGTDGQVVLPPQGDRPVTPETIDEIKYVLHTLPEEVAIAGYQRIAKGMTQDEASAYLDELAKLVPPLDELPF